MLPETEFAIASISKQFVCTAAALLAEEGELSLDDKVSRYFPEVTRAEDITLFDALTHVAGFRDFYPLDFVIPRMREPIDTDALIAELTSGANSQVYRNKVVYALGQIARVAGASTSADPQAAQRAIHALVRSLGKSNASTAATEALRNTGAIAVPALVAHLDGKLEGDTLLAVSLLGDIGDARATPTLVAELDRGRIPYTNVLEALKRCGDQRALMPILNLLSTRDNDLRLQAMTALRAVITDDRAADALLALVADSNLDIRVLAIEYLGLMRATSAVPALMDSSKPGEERRVRIAAIDALGEIGDARATPLLMSILERGPAELTSAAANALIYVADPAAIERLTSVARARDASHREHAVRALGGILRDTPSDAVRELLQQLARTATRPVALAAIEALGSMGDVKAVPT